MEQIKKISINGTEYTIVDETALHEGDLPTALPNPHKLFLVGGCTAEYDGSSEVTVEIPSTDLSNYYTKEETQRYVDSCVPKNYATQDDCVAKNQGASNVGKILVVGTDGNLTLTDMPEGGASGDVVGVLDESNNILLSGNLADGTYTLKYENANGTYTEIGNLVVSSIANHAIVTNLENCTSSGSTSIRANGSATVTVIANSGYALPDSITVSGASYTWDKSTGNIVLSNPTSDVYVTVTAVKAKTNFLEPNTTNTTDWAIWCNDSRVGSDGTYRSSTTQDTTNYIPVQNGDIIHINQGRIINSQTIGFYNSSKAKVTAGATTDLTNNGHIADATALSSTTLDAQFTITNASVAYIRFTLLRSSFSVGDDEIIVNIKRNGEWL